MKNKILIEVLLPSLFIISITLIIQLICSRTNLALLSFFLCSFLVYKKYSENTFWRMYWTIIKFPLYICTIIFSVFLALFSIISFQLIFVIAFGCWVYFLLKISYSYLGLYLDFELLLYLSITMSTVFLSFDKRCEISANKGMQEAIKDTRSNKSKNKVMRFFEEFASIYDIVNPKYSSGKMRYSIYVFYFVLLILSNMSPYFDDMEVIENIINSKAVNGSVLTYLAFDNLYQNRKAVSDINKRNFYRIVKVAIAKNRRAFYPKKR